MTRQLGMVVLGVTLVLTTVAATLRSETGAESKETLKELASAREKVARRALDKIDVWGRMGSGADSSTNVAEFVHWSHRLMDAEHDLADTDEQRVAAIRGHLDRLSERVKVLRIVNEAGRLRPGNDLEMVEYCLLEAKEMLITADARAD